MGEEIEVIRRQLGEVKSQLLKEQTSKVSEMQKEITARLEEQRKGLDSYYNQLTKDALEVARNDWCKDQDQKINNAFERGMLKAASKDDAHLVEKIRIFYLETIDQITDDVMKHVKLTNQNASNSINNAALRERKKLLRKMKEKKRSRVNSITESD